ncbi:MAG: aminotransferase class III-fold pyridoxal phosphate-dependent enzyme, partial [Bradyrhizobium sp.]|nr:aminotransferase class III-fold pyridoxal phosphate-dependent enzyme [Bradyrhizobium sp.]
GRRLYETEPIVRDEIDTCAEVLLPDLNLDLRQILFPSKGCEEEAQKRLTQTAIAQPALFVVEHAIARLLEAWGVVPVGMIGHSLGDYVAACLAGVFSRDCALGLLAKRARLMQDLPAGSMLAVRAKADEVQELLSPQVAIAGLNGETMTVLSGDTGAIRAVEETLTCRGIASKYLATSHAFHSAHMDPIVERFASIVATVPRNPPKIPFISSLTGEWIADDQATDPRFWARQLREPVRFAEGAARLFDDPTRILLEVGPGQTLTTLVRQHPGRKASQVIVTSLGLSSDGSNATSAILLAAGKLWAAGADLNWPAIHGGARRCRIPLPTYPFERKRYWIEPHFTADEICKTAALQRQTEEHENIMPRPNGEAQAGPARKDQLVERLQALFAELSGLGTADLNPRTGFLELGLDSLLLTQASAAIQKSFRVKIPFRDLLEDLSTLDALAGRLDAELPVEPKLAAEALLPANVVTNPAVVGPGAERVVAGSPLERIFARQLELMSRQLDMLRDGGAQETPPADVPRTDALEVRKFTPTSVKATERPTISFGPYRPPIKSASGGLTPKQDQRLKEFVRRYTQRTPGSKAFTARHRAMLADPRSVAGFRTLWKEMVYPIVASRSAGSKLWDVDGNEYVDLVNGFGAILFGHNPPFVREAIEKQLERGIEIGPQTSLAGEVAALVAESTGMQRVAFCNTGSEAVTAAIRVARTVSGRDLIVSFTGAYHGVFDEVLVRPTHVDGELRSMPIAPGIPSSMTDNIIVLEYGSAAALETLKSRASVLAAVLVEPVQSRRPEMQPVEFLREVRSITEAAGVALIFDEIVSGFRAHLRGTQAVFDVRADLATYGKVVGGGLPIGLVTGSSKYMDALDGGQWSYGDESLPEVGVTFFAGTFVRHPLALAAARAVLLHLREAGPELQRNLNLRTTELVDILNGHAEKVGAPLRVTHFSSWFCFNFPQDVPYAGLFYAHMRDKGVHIWEGRAGFLTTAHTDADLDRVVTAFKETIEELQEAEFLPGGAPERLPGARLGKDMNGRPAWFVPDPDRPGRYLQVNVGTAADV